MKLTDENILELAVSSKLAQHRGTQYIPVHWPDTAIGLELVTFARAVEALVLQEGTLYEAD